MECIESIYQFSKDCKLQPPLFEVVENEISLLSKYLQLNGIETILFANAFVLWFENSDFTQVFSTKFFSPPQTSSKIWMLLLSEDFYLK